MRGLYIHIPFCVRKCKYCDFVSYPGCIQLADSYIDRLTEEMRLYEGEEIDTVFIGGGTPTVLNAGQLSRLTASCFEIFDIADDYEFIAEANPGTIDREKAEALLRGGVNRISVGVQSFNDDELKTIGRIHDAKTAYNTILSLSKAGFKNINADIMTALPYQTKEKLMQTLRILVKLPVTHISAYSLIIEENTPLKKEFEEGGLMIPDDDADREMYAMVKDFLAEHGFFRYEISNFAKSGYECRHNIKYWECREYIGIGTAASSYFKGRRYTNTADINKYIEGQCCEGKKRTLESNDTMSEFMMLGLRMDKGISVREFKKRFGRDIQEVYGAELKKFTDMKLLIKEGDSYRFSDRGLDVSNSVLCEFML